MKFIIQILSLLLISSVLSISPLKRTVSVSPFKRAISVSYDNPKINDDEMNDILTEECKNELLREDTLYSKCMISIDSSLKESCKIGLSDECKKFYKDPLSTMPGCKNDPNIDSLHLPDLMNLSYIYTKLICHFDEDGYNCPLAETIVHDIPMSEDRIELSCKSTACTEGAIEFFEDYQSVSNTILESINGEGLTFEEKTAFKEIAQYLKSKECTSQSLTSDKKSDAKTIKVGTTFLVTLVMLLLAFI
ncbi:hypothetical protein BCR32DRAFT_324594 [Anaeromyces robustus]|jgi:hypothetical protein|uniref:Uncharacterized protein n=1 Tax=Anaeromyces robustus TaxID=1754192 RepID=A0A1Y1XMZ6_9FUNG|nr:hypothetical protein BCR32DRAFT_324594 [Anaeromyces robustus]|eukprot:ORX87111.1 hypothetical protein BCR32DRAFT_324594 [Anaeromyces robustus]